MAHIRPTCKSTWTCSTQQKRDIPTHKLLLNNSSLLNTLQCRDLRLWVTQWRAYLTLILLALLMSCGVRWGSSELVWDRSSLADPGTSVAGGGVTESPSSCSTSVWVAGASSPSSVSVSINSAVISITFSPLSAPSVCSSNGSLSTEAKSSYGGCRDKNVAQSIPTKPTNF